MINDDNDSRTLSNSDSIIIPVTTDNSKLEWDGNPATIAGMLYEVERFFTRVGLFQVLISDRAVALSNGKLAIEDANTVLFVSGTAAAPPGTFERPCPASTARLTASNVARTRAGSSTIAAITEIPDTAKDNFIIAKHLVQKEDARLLRSLTYVFGFADSSDALFDQANGSGLKLIELLNTRAAAATTRDKALVSIMLSSIIATGVGDEGCLLDRGTEVLPDVGQFPPVSRMKEGGRAVDAQAPIIPKY